MGCYAAVWLGVVLCLPVYLFSRSSEFLLLLSVSFALSSTLTATSINDLAMMLNKLAKLSINDSIPFHFNLACLGSLHPSLTSSSIPQDLKPQMPSGPSMVRSDFEEG